MAACVRGSFAKEDTPRPNIIFIFIDDMGYADPGCFGNPKMKTPNMDRLAAEGVRFTNFYVNSPICSPSRVAVTTGQYPARWKIHSYLNSRVINRSRGMADYLDPDAPTIARTLKSAGYATAHFGKWHMGGGRDVDDAPLPSQYGFDQSLVSFEGLGDRLLPPGGLSVQSRRLGQGTVTDVPKHKQTELYVDRAIDFIRRHKDDPFFLRLFPNDVHDGHEPAPGALEKWQAVTENPFERRFFAVLDALDRQLGRLVGEVDRLGLAEQTLIVLTSDNGPTDWPTYYKKGWDPPGFTGPFFGRKWSLFEGGIRMPFIARWVGTIAPGRTDESTVMGGIDLLPTFCSLAGCELPAGTTPDGEDMSRALLGTPFRRKKPLFWQYGGRYARLKPGNPAFISPDLAVRDGNWKLLVNEDGSDAQLFNLADDPGEKNDLLGDRPDKASELYAKLGAWARDTAGIEVAKGAPRPPLPGLLLAGRRRRYVNRGVTIEDRADGMVFAFDGHGYLDVPRAEAPDVAGRSLSLKARIRAEKPDGVILAQGGDRCGYSLYLKDAHLAFSVCNDWKRVTVKSPAPLPAGEHLVTAALMPTGLLRLTVDGSEAGERKSPGLLDTTPGDSLQVGADTVKPVGDYGVDNVFKGTIRDLDLAAK